MNPPRGAHVVDDHFREEAPAAASASHAEQQSLALPAAATQPGCTQSAATALELEGQVQGEARTRGAHRVTHGDRAAVDVHDVFADFQLAHRLNGHRCERLVDLEQVDVVGAEVLPGQRLADGVGRLG